MIYSHNALAQLLHISISYPGMQRLCDEGLEECRDIQTDGMMTIAIKSVIVPILLYVSQYACHVRTIAPSRSHRALRLIELGWPAGPCPGSRPPSISISAIHSHFQGRCHVLHSVVRILAFELASSGKKKRKKERRRRFQCCGQDRVQTRRGHTLRLGEQARLHEEVGAVCQCVWGG